MRCIPTHELRVGIYVMDGNEIIQLDKDTIECFISGRCEADPIEITDERLESLGFNHTSDHDNIMVIPNGNASELNIEKDILRNTYNIVLTRGDTSNGVAGKDYDYVYAGECKYVHQLQTVWISLTRQEELTFK